MVKARSARCAFCGEQFTAPHRPGPPPTYCSQAHRQRAYEQRRRTGRSETEQAIADELRALRARVRSLEAENQQLRAAYNETVDELIRLKNAVSPAPEGLRRLQQTPHPSTAQPAAEPPARPRKWWQSAGR